MLMMAYMTVCLLHGNCAQKTVLIEPAACHTRSYRGAIPANSEWKSATFKIQCTGKLVKVGR